MSNTTASNVPLTWTRCHNARVRTYRFHSLSEESAAELAAALAEDGMKTETIPAERHNLPGWGVVATGDDRSEGLLEMLAEVYGGSYEGEGLAGA
jgi:hypothetical protein